MLNRPLYLGWDVVFRDVFFKEELLSKERSGKLEMS